MTHTLAAVFDNRTDAERAQEELIKAGFSSGSIQLNDAATATGATSSDDDDDSILGSIKHFFMGLLGREHGDPHVYAEAVHRGHIVLTMDASSRDQASARSALSWVSAGASLACSRLSSRRALARTASAVRSARCTLASTALT